MGCSLKKGYFFCKIAFVLLSLDMRGLFLKKNDSHNIFREGGKVIIIADGIKLRLFINRILGINWDEKGMQNDRR